MRKFQYTLVGALFMRLLKVLFLLGTSVAVFCTALGLWSALTLRKTIEAERDVRRFQQQYDQIYALSREMEAVTYLVVISPQLSQVRELEVRANRLSESLKAASQSESAVNDLTDSDEEFYDLVQRRLSHVQGWLKSVRALEDKTAIPSEKLIDKNFARGLEKVRDELFRFQWGYISAVETRYATVSKYLIIALATGGTISLGLILGFGAVAFREIKNRERVAAKLREAERTATAAVAAKGRFVASVSHELRTPLNAIIGFAEMLLNEIHDPKTGPWIKTILRSGESLLRIVNDILDFSRLESPEFRFESGKFDFEEVAGDVHSLLKPLALKKNLDLAFVVLPPGNSTRLVGDAGRITQILRNLLGNALKFTSNGGIFTLIELKKEGDVIKVDLRVMDTGPGISADKRDRLFSPFFQAHEALDPAALSSGLGSGTGLGLSICNHLSRLMGGSIEYISLPSGSCFRVQLILPVAEFREVQTTLPVGSKVQVSLCERLVTLIRPTFELHGIELERSQETIGMPFVGNILQKDPATSKDISSEIKKAIPKLKLDLPILVVDDNPANLFVVEMQLHQLGLRCHLASDGPTAVNLARLNRYGLVMMDCQMPGMDGYAATKEIRNYFDAEELPVVALTANVQSLDRAHCHSAGMNGVLGKPLRLEELASAIQDYTQATALPVVVEEVSRDFGSKETAKIFDISAYRKLENSTNAEVASKVRSAFLKSAGRALGELREEHISFDKIRYWAHFFRAPALTLGAEHLSQVAISVEKDVDSRPRNTRSLNDLRAELQNALESTVQAFSQNTNDAPLS